MMLGLEVDPRLGICILGLALSTAALVLNRKWRGVARLPPGPAGYPVIGNLLSMPTSEEWLYWSKLSARYGGTGNCITIISSHIVYRPNHIGARTGAADSHTRHHGGL